MIKDPYLRKIAEGKKEITLSMVMQAEKEKNQDAF